MYFSVLQCTSKFQGVIGRGLSRSTNISSIVSAAADIYRYDDVPMGRGALITQLKKVVSESTPTPSQKKPIEMAHIRRMAV